MLASVAVKVVATTLQALREERHLSRAQLGTLAGVHPLTILRIEHARSPRGIRFDTLRRLAAVFGVQPHELVAQPGPPPELPVPLAPLPETDVDVLFIADLASKLQCSIQTLRRTLRFRPWDLPRPLPSVDKRFRWSRRTVDRWLDGDVTAGGSRQRPAPRRKPLARIS